MPIIGFLVGCALIIYGLVVAIHAAAFLSANTLVAFDKLLGGWPMLSLAWSWALNGVVCGSLIYFACEESNRTGWPEARPLALWATAIWLTLALLVGVGE